MKARFFSSMLAAFMLATASVGGITASAAERASAGEDAAKTTAVDEDSSADTTETTADTEESSNTEVTSSVSEESDDMEKFREVMSDLAEAGTTEVEPDYYGDSYYDTDGNATLISPKELSTIPRKCSSSPLLQRTVMCSMCLSTILRRMPKIRYFS